MHDSGHTNQHINEYQRLVGQLDDPSRITKPQIGDCDDCGLSPKAIKNGFLLGGALWLVLIGITLGVLKIFN